MNFIFSLVLLLLFHFFISPIHAEFSSYPLVYNPYISKLYEKSDPESIQSITYPVFSACPAESDEEKQLIDKQLIDGKALFIRKFYTEDIMKEGIKLCEKNFELAVVINSQVEPAIIEFGYEIYFETSEIPEKFRNIETSSFTDYSLITGENLFTENPSLAEDRPLLNFMWIKKLIMKYNAGYWDVQRLTYDLHRRADRIHVQCNDNNLGMKYFKKDEEEYFNFCYSNENIKNILKEIKIPEGSTCQSTENGCLEKYNLLKPHHFQTPSSYVSCSNLTSIPIWSEVNKELLNYSELFLTAISEITENQLIITSGTYKLLSLPIQNESGDEIDSRDIYLGTSEWKITVPQIIYKIVRYKSHDCDDKIDICWFNMVIAIHNEPKVTDKLCLSDKCEEWGWESIQYMSRSPRGGKYEHIYCCELDDPLKEKLEYESEIHHKKELNLKQFPVYNKVKGKNDFEDRQNEFLDKMDTLLEELKDSHDF